MRLAAKPAPLILSSRRLGLESVANHRACETFGVAGIERGSDAVEFRRLPAAGHSVRPVGGRRVDGNAPWRGVEAIHEQAH
jgi:hypothetical protein